MKAYFQKGPPATIPVGPWMNDGPERRLITETMILAQRAGATTVALISEIWAVESNPADTNIVREALAGRLHVHPRRHEQLMITADTEVMSYLIMGRITRHGGQCDVGKWLCTSTGLEEFAADTAEASRLTNEDMTPRFQDIWRKSREAGKLTLEAIIEESPHLAKFFQFHKNA